jgi:hypothetical protein
MRANVPASAGAQIVPVLVTPVTTAKEGAIPHLESVALWPLEEFRQWARGALATIRDLRRTFSESGDPIWLAQAAEAFERQGLDASSLVARLAVRSAAKGLTLVN